MTVNVEPLPKALVTFSSPPQHFGVFFHQKEAEAETIMRLLAEPFS